MQKRALRTEPVTRKCKDFGQVKELYVNSFPKHERIPMPFLLWKSGKKFVDFVAFYDEDTFVGFAYLVMDKGITFVLFLATSPELRSKGYGTDILSLLQKQYADSRIILNIEALEDGASNAEQRVKRKNFYLNNGFRNAGFSLVEYGQLYEVLVYGDNVTSREYRGLMHAFVGGPLSFLFVPKFIEGNGV
ncbi:GNAT family N-acetyltransferase [Paenibacillus tepidiphilus]|uniref:GNAT family N-acetyltransferase n=1 Tax=Paenibacillus tepidiphilus TaxID=2608683 RepID=UPI00123C0B95|nr:GNAT family N-acetyltransferase [Paenibacillus tepidiphilus]